MDGFGWLISLVGFVLALVALNKISKLDTTIAQLKLQLGQLSDQVSQLRQRPEEEPKSEKPVVAAVAKKVRVPVKTGPVEKIPEPMFAWRVRNVSST